MKTCLNCQAENPDDARYCQNCGFTLDWSTTGGDYPTQITEMLPAARLQLAIGPAEAAVAPGGSVILDVRIANRGREPVRALLQIAGEAARFSAITPDEGTLAPGASGSAQVTVSVPSDAPPATMPIEVYATEIGGTGASSTAEAVLAIVPSAPPSTGLPPPARRRGCLLPIALALVVIALVAVLALVLFSGDEESGVEGRVLSPSGVCAHSTPDLEQASTTPRGAGCVGLDHDETFRAACVHGNTLRIAAPDRLKGDYITRDPTWVELSDEVPPCD